MDRQSTQKLRLDRRLIGRRGWISPEDLQRDLDALPDVSDKIATGDNEEEPAESAEPTPPPEAPSA